jgi:hypothetical protein
MLVKGKPGVGGMWWMKIPKGANGPNPTGMALGLGPSASLRAPADSDPLKWPAPSSVPALAAVPRNARREKPGLRKCDVLITPPMYDQCVHRARSHELCAIRP